MTDFVIINSRIDRRGFRDTMFYTGERRYGVAILTYDSSDAPRFSEHEANHIISSESWPDDVEVGVLPVMDTVHGEQTT